MKKLTALTMMSLVAAASSAFAFSNTSSSAIGYDFYDFAVRLSAGPTGLAIAIGGVVLAGFFIFRQQVMPACGCLFGGIAVFKAGTIAQSIGAIC